jgi:tetratricopeptide (TPR) repeat protein
LRVPEAIAEYEQAISLDPTLPDVNYRLGVLYSDLNRIEKAVEAFQRELKINPESASANYSLGAYYLNYRNDAEQARQYFERSIKLNPTPLEPYLGLMKIELSGGKASVAIDLAQRVEAVGQ